MVLKALNVENLTNKLVEIFSLLGTLSILQLDNDREFASAGLLERVLSNTGNIEWQVSLLAKYR